MFVYIIILQGKNETEPVTKGDILGQFSYVIDNGPIQEFSVEEVNDMQ